MPPAFPVLSQLSCDRTERCGDSWRKSSREGRACDHLANASSGSFPCHLETLLIGTSGPAAKMSSSPSLDRVMHSVLPRYPGRRLALDLGELRIRGAGAVFIGLGAEIVECQGGADQYLCAGVFPAAKSYLDCAERQLGSGPARSVRLHAGGPRDSQPDLVSSSERLWQTVSRIREAIVSTPDQIRAEVFSILNSVGKPITIYAPLSPRPGPDGLRAVCEPVPNYADA